MTYIPKALREQINTQAKGRCEYCLIHEDDAFWPHELDHIFAEKHGGTTDETNLCLCCEVCNGFKGSDLCSLDPLTGEIVSLFHPRRQNWQEHFRLNRTRIEPLTASGRVTVKILRINDDERLQERAILIAARRYP